MHPRFSARLLAKAEATAASQKVQTRVAQQNDPGAASSSSKPPNGSMKRPAKRQKTAATEETKTTAGVKHNEPGNKGKEQQQKGLFVELPFDVLLEIFKYVEPRDLLNLSYTSKELRSILTAEYAATIIWTKSYRNIELAPACPPGIGIWHFTSVFFGNNCVFCAAPRATFVHFEALTRLCNTCAFQELIRKNCRGLDPRVPPLCWSCCVKSRSGWYILRHDYERHVLALEQCPDEEAKLNYIATKTEEKRKSFELSRTLRSFHRKLNLQKADDIQRLRSECFESIRKRLADEGYVNLGDWFGRLEKLPGANSAAPLTEQAWNRIKFRILGIFELQRQDERKKTMVETFKLRLSYLDEFLKSVIQSQPKPWIHPTISTVAKSKTFASVLASPVENADESGIKTKIATLSNHIPEIIENWREEADEYLLGLLSGAERPMRSRRARPQKVQKPE